MERTDRETKKAGRLQNSRFVVIRPFGSSHSAPLLGMFLLTFIYFFFGDGLVCANALPATDLVLAPVLPFLNMDDAFVATNFDVCLLFLFAIRFTSLHN